MSVEPKRLDEKDLPLVDLWESDGNSWEVSEVGKDATEVDGKHVIGRVRGSFFVPDGTSENKRYYPHDLWETVLGQEKIQKRLAGRLMFGTIGHDESPVTEQDLRNGAVSHVVSKLWLEGGKGMGEALILGTDAGQNLLTYLRAGSKLKTSSRANGRYENRMQGGMPVVDKSTYILETFDFVIVPGFPQVEPGLVENKHKLETNMNEGSLDLNKIVETLTASRDSLQTQVSALLEDRRKQDTEMATLRSQAEAVTADKGKVAAEQSKAALEQASIQETLKAMGFGTVPEAVAYLKALDREAVTALQEVKYTAEVLRAVAKLGTPDQVKKALDECKAWESLGAREAVTQKLATQKVALEAYAEIGEAVEVGKVLDEASELLEKYVAIGTPTEILESLGEAKTLLDKFVTDKRKASLEAKVEAYSGEFGLPVDSVRTVLESMTEVKARKVFESMKSGGRGKPAARGGKEGLVLGEGKSRLGMSENMATRFFNSIQQRAPAVNS